MRRFTVLLCLIVTLSGPLLRQEEAASDLARALATLIVDDDRLGAPDGGVGDDTGETILKAAGGSHVGFAWCQSWDRQAVPRALLPSFSFAPSANHDVTWRWQETAPWPPVGTCQRHAWLQIFLC